MVGPNGCGKSTLLAILAGYLKPTSGSISGTDGTSAFCAQETNTRPSSLDDFMESYDKDAMRLKGSLDLFHLSATPWEAMSHGERKRVQLGIALAKRPHLLLLDEPTNHLDAKNRNFIAETLRSFKGIGILVSHDRELLDLLCTKCIVYHGGAAISVTGNYSEAEQSIEQESITREKKAQDLKDTAAGLKREARRIAQINQGSKNRLSKRGLSPKDHDAKTKIEQARLTGKDSALSQKKIDIDRRLAKAEEAISSLRTAKSYSDSIFFATSKTHKKQLLHLQAQEVSLPVLKMSIPELELVSGSKIGIVGHNGSGKSSLVNWLLAKDLFRNCDTFYLRQELGLEDKAKLKKELESCSKEDYAKCLQIIARLGSDAKQILSSDSLSSGETRKVAIALAIVREVDLLILDEPTNHLDLHSVKQLELALSSCNIAVLLISHDRYFVDAVCEARWQISREVGDSTLEVIL